MFEPRKFQLDYEAAALGAIARMFPEAEIKGCNFHYTQAVYRKVQVIGLKKAYDEDVAVRRQILTVFYASR